MAQPRLWFALALTLLAWRPAEAGYQQKPRIGIFISRASYASNRDATQMSGKGWAGIANLAGIPYDTLLLEDMAAQELSRYRLLVFAQCSRLEEKLLPEMAGALNRYLGGGGNVIRMEYYEQLARRFALAMTHGYEETTPIAFGNLTCFTGPHKNLVVVDNVPAPDWAWFYMPDWSYSTAQITSNQEAILDHMFRNVGRGVIFSLMWHDYSITTPPLSLRRKSNRIQNDYNMPLYEAVAKQWPVYPIYCPEPADLVNKVRAMAQWDYSWKSEGKLVEMELDLSRLRLPEPGEYIGGMGVRIENTGEKIKAVTINGQPHLAFGDRIIILPNLNRGVNRIAATLGAESSQAAHLTYVSKRMPFARKKGKDLEFRLLTKSKGRFSLYTSQPAVLPNADWQEWDRKRDHHLNGHVTSDRTLVLTRAKRAGFGITQAGLPIAGLRETAARISLTLESAGGDADTLRFRSARAPKSSTLGDRPVQVSRYGSDFEISLPQFRGKAELHIEF